LEVDYQGSLRLVYDYGEQDISAPVPPSAEPGGSSLDVVTDAGRLVVRIDDRACSDVMSGQRFSKTVTVELAGRRLEGCGRALDGTAEWTVSPSSAGPVHVGMTREAAEAALGTAFVPPAASPECGYLRSDNAPAGVLFMYVEERIVRIDVTRPGVATTLGVEVGAPEALVFEAYGAAVSRSPHKYTSGSYLTISTNGHRLVFETDHARVTRYRAGRLPEVEWVEGCS
jgi:hypothetical protein